MTNLNNLCTSLELSKRLKELGCKQDSVFHWVKYLDEYEDGQGYFISFNIETGSNLDLDTAISAYTAGELGEMLPLKVKDEYHEIVTSHDGSGKWNCGVYNVVSGGKWSPLFEAETMADAMAEMLIFLLTSNLVSGRMECRSSRRKEAPR